MPQSGITVPTPIQAATLPDSLSGRDVLGRGRTGSGKTIAFALPLIARLDASGSRRTPKRPRALILAPTRELVSQIDAAITPLAQIHGLKTRTVFGGVGQNPQVQALRSGVDVLVACPGRLEDLIQQGLCDLSAVEVTVIDEADHMADLGFLPAVRRILDQTPKSGQRMLFSATLDSGVNVLVKRFLDNPATHEADSAQSPISQMDHHVLHVHRDQRVPVLVDLTSAPGRTIVFTRTKHGAKALARQLNARGVPTVELHGNLAQNARTRNMEAFHSGKASTLVATDIAARGIHVDDVALVVHADPPAEHKAYLHRSGRTARAGAAGNGHHDDDRPAGQGRQDTDARCRHQADHDQGLRPRARPASGARSRRNASSSRVDCPTSVLRSRTRVAVVAAVVVAPAVDPRVARAVAAVRRASPAVAAVVPATVAAVPAPRRQPARAAATARLTSAAAAAADPRPAQGP